MSNKNEKIKNIVKIFEKIKDKLEDLNEDTNLNELEKDFEEFKNSLDDQK